MSDTPNAPVPGEGTAHVKTRTPRPDELSREAFAFIAAIDDYKRRHMRSFLDDEQVLTVAHELGWYPREARRGKPTQDEVAAFARARDAYRKEHGRLFPSWSEVFEILLGLGYEDRGRAA